MSTAVTTTISTSSSTEMKLSLDNPLEDRHTPAPYLPVELLQLIIAQINDRSSLYALILSSHFLRYHAEPYLYASPMSPYPSPNLPTPHPASRCTPNDDPSTHLSFLRTVCTTPRLALLVRAYHSPSVLKHTDTPLWRYTARAFRMMKGLKELRLRTFDGRSAARSLLLGKNHRLYLDDEHNSHAWVQERWLSGSGKLGGRVRMGKGQGKDEDEEEEDGDALHGLTDLGPSFQLHTFHWGCHCDEKGITAFLQTQQALCALSFPDSDTRMYVQGLGDAGLGRLTVLEFGGSMYRPMFVSLAETMVGLEVLELVDCHEEDLIVLHTLPSLRELILSNHRGASSPPIPLPALFFFALPSSMPLDHTNSSQQHTDSTLRPRTSTIPPLPIASLFASCAKLECVDVALCAHLIPPVIMADFVGRGGSVVGDGGEVRLYARWKGRKRWCGADADGEVGVGGGRRGKWKKGFELLMVDEIRRGRLTAYW